QDPRRGRHGEAQLGRRDHEPLEMPPPAAGMAVHHRERLEQPFSVAGAPIENRKCRRAALPDLPVDPRQAIEFPRRSWPAGLEAQGVAAIAAASVTGPSTLSSARARPSALCRVSRNSASGSESAVMPPPAATCTAAGV